MAQQPPLAECSDEELLACFRKGRRDAFSVLVRRYEGELYGYLRRYLADGELAEDVFQNTFIQVFTKLDQYETGRPVRPWLYTIATHQAIDAPAPAKPASGGQPRSGARRARGCGVPAAVGPSGMP